MKTKAKTKKFRLTKSENRFLSDLWKAPGSPQKLPVYQEATLPPNYGEDFANIAVQDWLKVSSPEFKNENKFPVFMYPDNGIGEALVTTGDYTRINEKYQDMPPSMSKLDGWKPDPNAPPQRTYFWFRLSDKYLYFSESKDCVNVLGSFRYIDDTLTAKYLGGGNCFELMNKRGAKYKYCATNLESMKKFLCHIQTKLRLDIDSICKATGGKTSDVKPGKMEEKIITQPFILIPLAQAQCNEEWTYKNHGKDWECLCKEGMKHTNN